MEGRLDIGILLRKVSFNLPVTLVIYDSCLLCCILNVGIVGALNVFGYQCLALLKYRFALSEIGVVLILVSDSMFMWV